MRVVLSEDGKVVWVCHANQAIRVAMDNKIITKTTIYCLPNGLSDNELDSVRSSETGKFAAVNLKTFDSRRRTFILCADIPHRVHLQGVDIQEACRLRESSTSPHLQVETEKGQLLMYECNGDGSLKLTEIKKKEEHADEDKKESVLEKKWREGCSAFAINKRCSNKAFAHRKASGLLVEKLCESKFTESFQNEIILTGVLYENHGFSSKPFDVTVVCPPKDRTLVLTVTIHEHNDSIEVPILRHRQGANSCAIF